MRRRDVSLVFFLAIAAGCASPAAPNVPSATGSSAPAASPTSGPSTASSSALTPFEGRYTTTIGADTGAPPGKWTLVIENGELVFTHPDGRTFSPGDVQAVTANEIVLAPDPACPDQQTPTEGRYRWRLAGDTLKFEEVSDSCRDRAATLTVTDWTLMP